MFHNYHSYEMRAFQSEADCLGGDTNVACFRISFGMLRGGLALSLESASASSLSSAGKCLSS